MGSPLRQLLRYLKRVPERLWHPTRRAAALRQLQAGGRPASIVVICHGNVCRSPYAAAVLRRRLTASGTEVRVESAGFFGPNRSAPPEAVAAAAARGVDLVRHRSRAIDRALLESADLALVMEPGQLQAVRARYAGAGTRVLVLGDVDPHPIRAREIRDPFGQSREVFDTCYDRIDRCVEQVVRSLSESR